MNKKNNKNDAHSCVEIIILFKLRNQVRYLTCFAKVSMVSAGVKKKRAAVMLLNPVW
ncbi:MAG TPA: hypothetical protein PK275_13275 [Chitinophagaceae bacterium]|nr:hypothetical protein [Chitinophagaceae bacterium]